jgi:tetratricopeptide (TPR) repeat protein
MAVVGRGASVERLLDKIERLTSAFAGEDPDLVGFMHAARALRAVVAGNPYVAYRELVEATEAFNRAGSLRHELEHSGGAGFFVLELGGMERGEAILRQTIERSSGLEHVCAVARHNLGRRVAETGRIEEGLALEREALASFERHGNHRMMGLTQCHIAWIMLLAGRANEAAAHADMAVELLQGQPGSVCLAYATRARIRLAARDVERALRDATVAIEGLKALDQVLEGESLIRLTWAEALAAAGRADEALAAIVEAQRNLEERAASVDDEELRGSFLNEVPENARIIRLAREWGAGTR